MTSEQKEKFEFKVGDLVTARRFDSDELSGGWQIIDIRTLEKDGYGEINVYLRKEVPVDEQGNRGYHNRRISLKQLKEWQQSGHEDSSEKETKVYRLDELTRMK